MARKTKGMVVDSTIPYVVGVREDAKARLKHQTLMQEYQELQKEVDVMRTKLEAGKQRKLILAAEVRFLQRRYGYFMKTKTMHSSEKETPVQPQTFLKQTKNTKEYRRKGASGFKLPPRPETKSKNNHCVGEEVALSNTSAVSQHHTEILHGGKEATQLSTALMADTNHKGKIGIQGRAFTCNRAPVLKKNQKERMHVLNDASSRNTAVAFDLNQDNCPREKEASSCGRAPIFDLNEISTGDEDFQSNIEAIKFEEVKKSLMTGPNDEVQNDLKMSICRNAGEGPFHVGKRKISWRDPVALRV